MKCNDAHELPPELSDWLVDKTSTSPNTRPARDLPQFQECFSQTQSDPLSIQASSSLHHSCSFLNQPGPSHTQLGSTITQDMLEYPYNDDLCTTELESQIDLTSPCLDLDLPCDGNLCPTELDSQIDLTSPSLDHKFSYNDLFLELDSYMDLITSLSETDPSNIQKDPSSFGTLPTQIGSSQTQVGPPYIREDPSSFKTIPTQIGPSQTQAGSSHIREDPSSLKTFPTQIDPSQTQAGPSHIREDPSSFKTFPTQIGPSQTQVGPSYIQKDPSSFKTFPTQIGPSPTQAAPSHIGEDPSSFGTFPTQIDPSQTQAGPSHIREDPSSCRTFPTQVDPSQTPAGPYQAQAGPSNTQTVREFRVNAVKCIHCEKDFTSENSLRRHLSIKHEEPPKMECNHCGIYFSRKDNLDRHIRRKHSDNTPGTRPAAIVFYTCSNCGRTYSTKSSLRRHLRLECGIPPQFSCSQCSFKTHHESNLKQHMNKKHRSDSCECHTCSNCGRTYFTKANLSRHLRLECGIPPQFSCSQCSFKAHQESNLKRHMDKKHRSDSCECHTCSNCGRIYSTKTNLSRHLRLECGIPPQFSCSQCSFKAHQESNLKLHMDNIHRSDSCERYTCPKCGHTYTLKGNLARHLRFECGIPPQFSCSQCSFKTRHKHTLKQHMLNIHGLSCLH